MSPQLVVEETNKQVMINTMAIVKQSSPIVTVSSGLSMTKQKISYQKAMEL